MRLGAVHLISLNLGFLGYGIERMAAVWPPLWAAESGKPGAQSP